MSHPGEALTCAWLLSSLLCHRLWDDFSEIPPDLNLLLEPCWWPSDQVIGIPCACDPGPWLTTVKQDAPAGKTSTLCNPGPQALRTPSHLLFAQMKVLLA